MIEHGGGIDPRVNRLGGELVAVGLSESHDGNGSGSRRGENGERLCLCLSGRTGSRMLRQSGRLRDGERRRRIHRAQRVPIDRCRRGHGLLLSDAVEQRPHGLAGAVDLMRRILTAILAT